MAVELATAYISLVPSFRGGEAAIAREASRMGRSAGTAASNEMGTAIQKSAGRGGGLGRGILSAGNAIKAGFVGLIASEVFGQLNNFVKAAEESAAVMKQTNAVIESTGGVANVTADHVTRLTDALSAKAGVDDELIQQGQNVLLTFTNIRNEVGEGNAIFDQASEAALNMSAALGTDLQGSVIQVGKALNDPIKGMASLSRAGVQFTEEQKNMITALVESGDTLGAQKIILAELTTQFGGAAEANATASGRMSVAWGNFQEQIGAALIPVIEKLANLMGEHLPGIMNALQPVINALGPVLGVVFKAWDVMITVQITIWRTLATVIQTVGAAIVAAVQWIVNTVLAVWSGIQPVVSFFQTYVVGPLVAVVQGLASVFGTIISGLVATAQLVWGGLSAIVSFFATNVVGPVVDAAQGFAGTVGLVISGLVSAANFVWGGLSAMVSTINDNVINPILLAVSAFSSTIKVVIGGLVGVVTGTWEGLIAIWDFIRDRIFTPIKDAVIVFKDHVIGAFQSAVDGVRTAWNFLVDAARVPINFVIRFYNNGIKRVWDATLAKLPFLGELPKVSELNTGGYVPGPDINKDVVPALLTPGEFVINKQSAKNIGPGLLEWLNDGGLRGTADPGIFGFATGGPVRSLQETTAFAQAQVGKPYQWPSRGPTVGPGSYDCSGFTSAVLNFALGLNPHSRRHSSTSQVNDPALAPGLGAANGLSFGNRAAFMLNKFGQSVGHTALTLGGINFEATPPRVRSGGGAKGAASFPRHMHLPRFGGPSADQIQMMRDISGLSGTQPQRAGPGPFAEWTRIGDHLRDAVVRFLAEQAYRAIGTAATVVVPGFGTAATWFSNVFGGRELRGTIIGPTTPGFAQGGEVRQNGPMVVGEYGHPEVVWGSRGQYVQAMTAGTGEFHYHHHGDVYGDAAFKRYVNESMEKAFSERRREALAGSRHP